MSDLIRDARDWLADCAWADDPDFESMTHRQIRDGVDRFYAGGWAAFVRDCGIGEPPVISAWRWLRLPRQERDRRKAEFRAADNALRANAAAEELAGVCDESDEFLFLNGRVNDLWPTVPWWCRR